MAHIYKQLDLLANLQAGAVRSIQVLDYLRFQVFRELVPQMPRHNGGNGKLAITCESNRAISQLTCPVSSPGST